MGRACDYIGDLTLKSLNASCFLLVFIIGWLVAPVDAGPAEIKPLRVGIVLLHADDAARLAEAAAIDLLPDFGVQSVERTEIDRMIKEQALSVSDLADPTEALRLGVALRADALLILEPNKQYIHARVMDTRHGVILGEALLEIEQPESFANVLRAILARALQKVRIPAEEMVYVSVMGVTASADVESLKTAAGQLGPLIRADLQAIPYVRVVEREQLAQIQRENQLADGEVSQFGSAIVIEGELRPVDDGHKTVLVVIITSQDLRKTISVKAEPIAPVITDLRASARGLIASHLGVVEADGPVLAGASEAAAILARTHWLAMHHDYDGAEGRVEAALLIDDSLESLDVAWQIYYQLAYANSRLHSESPLNDGRVIRAIRRHHELKFQMLRHPSRARSFQNNDHLYPIHFEIALVLAETDEHRRVIADIRRITDEWFDLAMTDRRTRGESIIPLLRFRLRTLVLAVDTPEEYVKQAKDLVKRIRAEATIDDWGHGDPAVMPFRDNFDDFYGYPDSDAGPYVPFDAQDVKPLFDWMMTQNDSGLRILAYWYLMDYGPEDAQAKAAGKILELIFETKGFHNPGFEDLGLRPNGYYPGLADYACMKLHNNGQLGAWFDGLLNRAEQSRSIDSLLNWYAGDIAGLVDLDDTAKTQRLHRLIHLVDEYSHEEDRRYQKEDLLKFISKLRKQFADEAKYKDVNPWDQYESRLVTVRGMTDEMREPAVYFVTGNRGDTDRQLYIAWLTDQDGQWVFTRCALQGGDLQQIGKAQVKSSENWSISNARMVTCNGYLVLGGVRELLVLSEKDGSSAYYGTKQGLPGAYIQSLAVVGDRVILGGENGLSMLDPATGRLEVIANALAVEARSPLDHTAPYRVSSIMTLAGYNRVWFTIEGNDRRAARGPWQYDLDTGMITKVEGSDGGPNTWKFRGEILAIRNFKRGFVRLDPDENELIPYEFAYDHKPWHYLLKSDTAPLIIGDHLFALHGAIIDTEGRVYSRFQYHANWTFGVELDDNSLFLGYPHRIDETDQPAMWIISRKDTNP